jgi:hypothetical protein
VKKFLVFLLILALIAVGVDFAAKNFAENRAAEQVQNRLGVEAATSVSFSGWPFLLHALDGNFPEVGLSAARIEAKGIVFSHVDVTLHDVSFEMSDVLEGSAKGVRAKGGTGSATISEKTLNQVLENRGADLVVDLSEGQASAEVPGVGLKPIDVSVDGGQLVLSAEGVSTSISIELPVFIDGLTYETARITDSAVEVEFNLGRTTLQTPSVS